MAITKASVKQLMDEVRSQIQEEEKELGEVQQDLNVLVTKRNALVANIDYLANLYQTLIYCHDEYLQDSPPGGAMTEDEYKAKLQEEDREHLLYFGSFPGED